MNKVNKVIDEINKRNFFTFFLLAIISLFVVVSFFIASSLLFFNKNNSFISKGSFIGIISLSILSLIIILLVFVSFFPLYKERYSLDHLKLLKTLFYLVIILIILGAVLIIWTFLFNSTYQKIIKIIHLKDDPVFLMNTRTFYKLKIFSLIINSVLILNIITIVSINTFIKIRGKI
ncbi:Hypothetical protein, predicted transmembrane protein [Metamycoplasma auris 15026]|uniref:Uncharacterized protein n=1 Tax=Metamycoplasma auris 15026 TaxID=1188233 RepID=N9VA92_9BACT|nr:Hypothetical protein, predicted transmembrane protein [Metamycoplasma auris 15026]